MYILGLYRDNGKENGNYDLGFRVEGFDSQKPTLLFWKAGLQALKFAGRAYRIWVQWSCFKMAKEPADSYRIPGVPDNTIGGFPKLGVPVWESP